ncbi:MAG TPA: hypothetical protein VNH18_20750, partial [Bryobacteraceae bacterium]|nr:hypothetical protein [Bryobacteraceae bacterium]
AATRFGCKPGSREEKWSDPILRAFIDGAWYLLWTPTHLYWLAKPIVKTETIATGRRLHCADGPACANDVENIYFWHGVLVPAYVIFCPEKSSLDEIRGEQNEEIKRVMIERWAGADKPSAAGWARYLKETGAKVIDSRRNDVENTEEALMRTPDGLTTLVCACPSTARVYSLECPPTTQTCEQAQSFLWSGSRTAERLKNRINIIGRS